MFKDITQTSGINYTGASYRVAWGEYNQDSLIDLWGNHVFPTLHQNFKSATFR